jgi:hypothetical protein
MANEGIMGPSRYGQTQLAGAEETHFLKVYGGMVLTAFQRETVTDGRINVRTITSGKSAQFPLMGAMSASFHTPGQNIIQEGGSSPTYLSQPKWDQKVININGILQTSVMVNDIDDFMGHFETRAAYAQEMGWALAKEMDIMTLQTIINGADTAATIVGDASDWGATENKDPLDSDFDTGTAANALLTIAGICASMDINDVPKHGRHIAIEPALYYRLLNEQKVVSADYNQQTGASGTGGRPQALQYLGMQIHPTNRLVDIRALTSTWSPHAQQLGSDYYSDMFPDILAVAWQQDWSVAVVKLHNLGTKSEYQLPYLGTLFVSGWSVGHGVLHESACFVVQGQI